MFLKTKKTSLKNIFEEVPLLVKFQVSQKLETCNFTKNAFPEHLSEAVPGISFI